MTNVDTIDNKISEIKAYLGRIHRYRRYSRKEIEEDEVVRDAVERVLFLAAQGAIDLGDMVVSLKKLPKPSSQGDIFQILKDNNFIPLELMKKLIAMTGFRNVIAHDYTTINYDRVFEVLHKDIKDIDTFLVIAGRIR